MEENSLGTEADSDVNVLGLTAQDLRDPGAIVSYSLLITVPFILFECSYIRLPVCLNQCMTHSVPKPSELPTGVALTS